MAKRLGHLAMKDNETASYYLIRAEQEEEAARGTTNVLAVTIHLSLASRYRTKACECEEVQRLRLVRD